MSYKKLQIWQVSEEVVIQIHKMTLEELPSFEMYEEGQQIRRSSKSVKSNIVEGYGRRDYKQEYLRFLTYSFASCLETIDHLETLFLTKSLKNKELFNEINEKLETLSKKIYKFMESVDRNHRSKK